MKAIGLSLLIVLALPRVAGAETASAKEHYKKGLSYYALGKYTEAAHEYEAAFELNPDPALLYNAAQAHRLAGNNKRALTLYQSFVRMFPKADDGSVQHHIAALKAAIEAEAKSEHAPPIEPRVPEDRHETNTEPRTGEHHATEPETHPATTEARTDVIITAPPPHREERRKRTPKWVWGVVGGVAALGIVIGVGLGVGLSGGTTYPTPSLGSGRVP